MCIHQFESGIPLQGAGNPGSNPGAPSGVSSNGRTPALVSPRKHCRRCAGFVSLGAQLDSGTRPQLFADVVQEEERSFRKREVGISSIPVGPIVVPGKDRWRSAALVRLTGEFKSPAGIHCRKALRASSRLITDREMVRFHLRQPSFHSGKVELAHHDGLISRSSKVRFLVPLPLCTWGMGLLAVVASLAMRIFSGVGIPGPPPVCLDS